MLAQGIDGSDVPETQCGNAAEYDRCRDRHERCKPEYERIESDFLQPRDGVLAEETQHSDSDTCQNESQKTTDAGKDQALDEHLTHQSAPASAQRQANCKLVKASRRSREHEIRHVHAGHEEHKSDGNEQEMQRATGRGYQILPQRNGIHGAQTHAGPALPHGAAEAREFLTRLLETDSRSQAANDAQRIVLGIGIPSEAVRSPDVHCANDGIFEALRCDADDFVWFTDQLHRRADDRRIAPETRTPQVAAQHDAAGSNRRASADLHFVAALEPGAGQWIGSKRAKVVACDPESAEPLRPAIDHEVSPSVAVVGEGGDNFEGPRLLAKE